MNDNEIEDDIENGDNDEMEYNDDERITMRWRIMIDVNHVSNKNKDVNP